MASRQCHGVKVNQNGELGKGLYFSLYLPPSLLVERFHFLVKTVVICFCLQKDFEIVFLLFQLLFSGVFADVDFKEDELILKDQILVGAQHSVNKVLLFNICFKFIAFASTNS